MPLLYRSVLRFVFLAPLSLLAANTSVHTSWLWHLHQPIYWPDRAPVNHAADHYQNAWDTIQLGNVHPNDTSLTTVFGESDRVNAYQGQPSSTVSGLLYLPNAGAQVNMSGALMENVQSLAAQGQLGYYSGWNHGNATARTWTTSSGKPRMDLVNFTYHHAMAPLVSDETLEMELAIQQRQMQIFWGAGVPQSRGYFPAETCFSEHMIPMLNKYGIAWAVVANNHLARTCPDMPVVTGSGGEMCDLPNLADQINPAQGAGNFQRQAIDRGCSPTQVMPFGFQLHYGRYVDPNTGNASEIILAPSDQVFGWKDSYSTWDLGLIAPLAARNNPAKPALVLCAHDGDNAWSGGSSYYQQWVGEMAGTAVADGYEPTTIEQFINDFPPDSNDVVHVEDGGWVFADGDMGSPSFINWNWPPSYKSSGVNVVDPSLGVTDKGDNWRVIIATENRVKTAQQILGITPRVDQVRDPGSYSTTPNAVELGWHYYLGSLDSGFVYYGCHDDECLRAIVAQSNAVRNVDSVIAANLATDTTPPTVFLPQRHPWNPGGVNFGVQYGYKTVTEPNSDFWIWTYAYDVSGITNVTLWLRVNGTNPPTSDQFKTYAGGPLAGAWQTSGMTQRITPDSSGYTPQYLADYYYSKVTGITNTFVDYYVSATDAHGNTYKSPIQHVYVGVGSGGGGTGSSGPVSVNPANPVAGNSVTIQYAAASRALASANPVYLHLGWNNYSPTVSPDAAMSFNSASNWWQSTVTIPATATSLNCCFNNGSGTWDNNGGANWNFTVTSNSTPQAPAAPAGLTAAAAGASQINLSWSATAGATGYIISRGGTAIASNNATSYADTGLSLNSNYCYTVVATNSVGNSAASGSQCATTLTNNPSLCNGRACVAPTPLEQGNAVTISYSPAGGPIAAATNIFVHLGWNKWASVVSPDPAMSFNAIAGKWQFTTNIAAGAAELDLDFNNGAGTWDNNGGSGVDYRFTVAPNGTLPPATPTGLTAIAISTNQIDLNWSAVPGAATYFVKRDGTAIAATVYANYADTGLATDSSHCYSIVASNSVGASAASVAVCASTAAATPGGGGSVTSGAVTVFPLPAAGNSVTIQYTATGRAIAAATNVYIHLGWNNWNPTITPDPAMTFNSASNRWQFTVPIPLTTSNLNCCFNNGSGTWDNNNNTNWNFSVTGGIPPFALDGNFDYPGYLLASSGMVLYGAVRGATLYVATWSPGTNGPNDHFIFVTDQLLPAPTAPAPWGKFGSNAVATTKPFLAGKGTTTNVSWYVNNVATNWPCAKSPTNAGAMAGTLDLVGAFGAMPTNLYLCAAAYQTASNGVLAAECPPGAGTNIGPNGFLMMPLAALQDSLGNGTPNLCDPARGFRIMSARAQNTNRILGFAAMPGRSYLVQWAGSLIGTWTNLPGTNYAAPPQTLLNFTDAPPAGTPQRYYRVQLLP